MSTFVLNVEENVKILLESSPPPDDGAASCTAMLLANVHCQLGECILYDDINDTILWTDIYGRQFYKLPLSGATGGVVSCTQLSSMMLCALALTTRSSAYLCAWHNGFQLFDLEQNKSLSDYSTGEDDVCPLQLPTRLNDGRCDSSGRRFICGGYFGENPNAYMKVFKVELNEKNQLVHSSILDKIQVTNSLCFSPDDSKMYLADSPTRQIHVHDYNKETGEIDNKRLVYTESLGVPDGSCCDAQGYIWNAVWRGGAGPSMVHRIDPNTGEIVFTVHMPDSTSQVSCCCLGGKDLDVLFITTASKGRDGENEPHAGGIYAAKVGFKGRKEGRFVVD